MKVFRRKIPKIMYSADNSAIQEIFCGNLERRLDLFLEGTIVISGGSSSGTVRTDGVVELMKKLTLYRDGSPIKNLTGALAFRKSQLGCGTLGKDVQIANGDAATTNFRCGFQIDFQNELARYPDTLLDLQRDETKIELEVEWGNGNSNDLVNGGDRTKEVTVANTFLRISPQETDQRPEGYEYLQDNFETITQETYSGTGDQTLVLPKKIGAIYQMLVRCTSSNEPVDTVLSTLSLVVDGNDYRLREIDHEQLQDVGKRNRMLETWPTGYYLIDLMPDGIQSQAIDSDNAKSITLELNLAAAGTVEVLLSSIKNPSYV